MSSYRVTVTQVLTMLVGNSPSEESARQFVLDLVDDDWIGSSEWDRTTAVEPYDPEA